MDYRVIGIVRKFFSATNNAPKFRSQLVQCFVESMSMAIDEAEELICSLIEVEYIHPVTVWFFSEDTDSLRSRPGLALGARVDTEVHSRSR
jgi:hypothetical protein